MKVALAGSRFVNGDMAFNLTQIEHWAREARRRGAELICFGEAFLQGFDALSWSYETDTNIAARTDSFVFTRLKVLSAGLGIDLLLGYIEKEGESLYSSCALIEGGRLTQNYRRISRGWKEYTRTNAHYREGVEPIVFSYRNKKCLIGLCGDLWNFPERFALGEDLLFWPVYIDYTPEEWEGSAKDEYALQAKKCCSQVLLINSLCREAGASGGACLFENGKVLRELPMRREELLLVELD